MSRLPVAWVNMNAISVIRVAIVEDNLEMSMSLLEVLGTASNLVVVATFDSGEEAVAQIDHCVPDVLLMDLRLPGMSGIECVRQLKKTYPALHVMMFTAFDDDDDLFQSLAAGATGYLLKRAKPAAVIKAIRELHTGGSPMSPGIARRLVQFFQTVPAASLPSQQPAQWPPSSLSPREDQVLRLLAQGLRYKEIANDLDVSINTVRTHLTRIYDKLHVTSRTEAVLKFLKADG